MTAMAMFTVVFRPLAAGLTGFALDSFVGAAGAPSA